MRCFRKLTCLLLIALLVAACILPAVAANRSVSNVIVVMPPSNPVKTPAPVENEAAEPEATELPEGTDALEGLDEPDETDEAGELAEGEEAEDLEETEEIGELEETAESEDIEETEDLEETEEIGDLEETEELEETEGLEEGEDSLDINLETMTQVEFPEDASVSIEASIRQSGDEPAFGDHVRLTSNLVGLENFTYQLQWQQCKEGGTWFDIADATEPTLNFIMTEENAYDSWRLSVVCYAKVTATIMSPEEAEAAAQEEPAPAPAEEVPAPVEPEA